MNWHRPQMYRYRVAEPGLRLRRNAYGRRWIGQALVAGRFAYCVKWAALSTATCEDQNTKD